jgi:hypothetical protein
LAWDATTPDTLAASHLPATSGTAGAAASNAAAQKLIKYRDLQSSHIIIPVAIETLGPWCKEGFDWIKEIGRRTSVITGDLRESQFLLQRISVAVQRGNAASVMGTLPRATKDDF